MYNSGDGSSRTRKAPLVVVRLGRLIFLRFSLLKICCCFVWIEWWIGGTVSFGAVVLVTTMNPFDDGLSRTWREVVTVVNSGSLTSTSSGLLKICCFVCIGVL